MEIDRYLAEETGIHVGDGSMNVYSGTPSYTFAGHHIDDLEYTQKHVIPLFERVYGIRPKGRNWSVGTYGFRVHSKEVVEFKRFLGLPLGRKNDVSVPKIILEDDELMKHFIRGLFDTDGSITLWRTNNAFYPRIYFVTVSASLFEQVVNFLRELDFRVTTWENIPKNPVWKKNYRLSINGVKMLRKWSEEIGFNNPKNVEKLKLFRNVYKEKSKS